jgi:hypothetical protein
MKKILYIGIVTLMLLPAIAAAQTSLSTVTNVSGTAVPAGQTEFNTTTAAETPPSYVLLAPLPCVGTTNGTTCTNGTNGGSLITSIAIQGYLVYLFKLMIALTVFLAVIMTIYGGFKYMTTEAVSGKGDAKKTIEDAIYGLLLALASYLILYTINPNLVNISSVAIPKLNVATTTVNLNGNYSASNNSPTQTTQQQSTPAAEESPSYNYGE